MTTRLDAYERTKRLLDVWGHLTLTVDLGEPDNIVYYLDATEVRFLVGTTTVSIGVDLHGVTHYRIKLSWEREIQFAIPEGEDRFPSDVVEILADLVARATT